MFIKTICLLRTGEYVGSISKQTADFAFLKIKYFQLDTLKTD